MISLAKKTGYGLIALVHLARTNECCVSARVIAAEHGVPLSLLMNVLKVLSGAGYVQSYRGPRGGYSLARPADQITVAEVMEIVEGPIRFVACAAISSNGKEDLCKLVDRCPIHDSVCRIHERIRGFLADVSIADLAVRPESAEQVAAYHSEVGCSGGQNPDIPG